MRVPTLVVDAQCGCCYDRLCVEFSEDTYGVRTVSMAFVVDAAKSHAGAVSAALAVYAPIYALCRDCTDCLDRINKGCSNGF